MNQERRKFLRLSVTEIPCQVKLGSGLRMDGELLDESIGGLRIGGLPLLAVSINQPVKIFYDGETVSGVCRGVSRQSDNRFTLGVRRSESAPQKEETESAMLLNTFMQFSGCDLLCLPVETVDEEHVRVMMIDSRQFVVERSRLFSLTREERMERLCSEKRYRNIMKVYQLDPVETAFSGRDAIVTREFGPARAFSMAGAT